MQIRQRTSDRERERERERIMSLKIEVEISEPHLFECRAFRETCCLFCSRIEVALGHGNIKSLSDDGSGLEELETCVEIDHAKSDQVLFKSSSREHRKLY